MIENFNLINYTFTKNNKMKKIILILSLFTLSVSLNAQIAVGSYEENGRIKDFKDGSYEKLLKTTTIFVFSNVNDKAFYESILNETWTLTPYEIIDYKEFSPLDYFSEDYSFCILKAYKNESLYHSYLELYMYDMERINKIFGKVKWEKLDERQTIGKKFTVSMENQISFGKIYFYAQAELFKNLPPFSGMSYGKTKGLGYNAAQMKSSTYVVPDGAYLYYMGYSKQDEKIEHLKTMHESFYNDKVHFNYEKGFISNYFQQFTKQMKSKELSSKTENFSSPQLSKLKNNTLYIPEYVQISYDGWKILDTQMSKSDISKVMAGYKYKYEFISTEALDEKINAGEEIYYLNYSRITATQIFQIINAKTGKPVFKMKTADFKYNIGPKNFEKMSKVISES